MKGGTISANTADGGGGGIVIEDSTFTMEGGAITGNRATLSGGGVVISRASTFTMIGGAIADNSARQYGGGVYLDYISTSFTMQGGTIAGNTAVSGGGGVAVATGTGVFTKAPAVEGQASGIIYGSNGGDNRNVVITAASLLLDDRGHAVYIQSGPLTRELTVLPDQTLDSTDTEGWEE
jgi:hypothetical protein